MSSDPLDPLVRRLTELTRDASNAVASAVTLFTGARQQEKTKDEVKLELFRLKAQFARFESAFGRLSEEMDVAAAHAGEINENDLIAIVDRIATAGMIAQQTTTVMALDYINTSARLLRTQPDRFIEIIREMDSHEGGRQIVEAFCKAAIDYYQEINDD